VTRHDTRFVARRWPALVLALALAACSSGPDKPKPQPLEPLTPQIAGRMV